MDADRKKRWGLILAGGDGVRLRPLTRFISRDERPKQFCSLYGGETTLLEQARRRAQRSIGANQILYSLNREHEKLLFALVVRLSGSARDSTAESRYGSRDSQRITPDRRPR